MISLTTKRNKSLEATKHNTASIHAVQIIDQPNKFKDPIKNNVGYEHIMMNHSLSRLKFMS